MCNRFLRVLGCALIVIGQTGPTCAADKVEKHRVVADTAEKFAATVKELQEEMSTDGRYEFISAGDRAKVNADISIMTQIFNKTPAVAEMASDQKIQLFNTQENLNGILTHNDRDRLVCERRAPVGTNIPITTCKTVGELEIQRRHTQDYLKNGGKFMCTDTSGKFCSSQ